MKKLLASLTLAVVVLMPSPAWAWFGWLDHLSGPGPFIGLLFDVRAVCFGERGPAILEQEAIKREAELLPAGVNTDKPAPAGHPASAVQVPDPVLAAWYAAAAAWAAAVGNDLPKERTLVALKESVRQSKAKAAARSSVGVLFSACSRDIVRRSSVDVSVDLWQAKHREARFAQGEAVSLTTAKIAYSFALFKDTDHDVLDVSIGAGAYWLASRGFQSTIRGAFLEPFRFYLHFPSGWREHATSRGKRWAAIPVFSAAAVVFPNGFAENVFLSPAQSASGSRQAGIGAEIRPSLAVYLHIYPK